MTTNFLQIEETQFLFKDQSELHESECGNYRIRKVFGIAGIKIETIYQAIVKQTIKINKQDTIFWHLISRHKTYKAAHESCIKHSKKEKVASDADLDEEPKVKNTSRGIKKVKK